MFVSRAIGPSVGFTAGGVVIDTSALLSVGISVILVHIVLLRILCKVIVKHNQWLKKTHNILGNLYHAPYMGS